MKTYKSVYSWEVIEKIREGNKVYVLDKEEKTVVCVNDVSVGDLAQIEIYSKTSKGRFEFWIEEITEEADDV